MDDLELLKAWRQGDPQAGDRLFRRHIGAVQRFFANKVANAALAEDLIQRTFLACIESKSKFEGRSTFRTYLLGIARHVLFAGFRAERKHRGLEDLGSMSLADMGHGVSTLVGQSERQQLLLAALRRLSLDQQLALELYYFEELSAVEAASALEVPEGTVRSRLRLGKDALKKQLEAATVPALRAASDDDLERWLRELRQLLPAPGEMSP